MQGNIKEKTRTWLLPDQKCGVLAPGLYLIASPIGNLADMSVRALDTLAGVDAVFCEDTRVTGKLLNYFGLKKTLCVYNDHSGEQIRAQILSRIQGGAAIALVSDAGMPLVSDPGYKLVEFLREHGALVTSVPGANAPLTALQLSGLPSDRFSFLGFLPSKSAARKALLNDWRHVPGTLVAFETAPRLLGALEDIHDVLGDQRRVAVAREMTKMYEEVRGGFAQMLIAHYQELGLPKGEIVLVIEPPADTAYSEKDVEVMIQDALQTLSTKDAAAYVAEHTGRSKKDLYDLALKVSR